MRGGLAVLVGVIAAMTLLASVGNSQIAHLLTSEACGQVVRPDLLRLLAPLGPLAVLLNFASQIAAFWRPTVVLLAAAVVMNMTMAVLGLAALPVERCDIFLLLKPSTIRWNLTLVPALIALHALAKARRRGTPADPREFWKAPEPWDL